MKKPNNSSAPASSSEKDNKTTKTSAALAKAWLAKHRKPNCLKTSHEFDLLLDQTIKCFKPDGSMNEVLRGFEGEVRQRAANLLFRSYFAGNGDLTAATDAGALKKVRMYLAQAILGALERCEFEILRREARIAKRVHLTDEVDYFENGSNIHPSIRKSLWELPVELQLQLVYAGLGLAVRENSLPSETAAMIRTLIKENCSVSEIARRIKISPQAAHKRIRRAGDYLKKFIDYCEFPS
jgi:hypothetical protein